MRSLRKTNGAPISRSARLQANVFWPIRRSALHFCREISVWVMHPTCALRSAGPVRICHDLRQSRRLGAAQSRTALRAAVPIVVICPPFDLISLSPRPSGERVGVRGILENSLSTISRRQAHELNSSSPRPSPPWNGGEGDYTRLPQPRCLKSRSGQTSGSLSGNAGGFKRNEEAQE
jgi:hypothetical protein